MNKSITQATQNDKQISNSIKRFLRDSMFERNRSKKVELLAKVYDHAKHKYRFGFRMLTLLDAAKKAAIPAKYVLFDSWFSSPSTLHAVKNMGYDVI